MKIREEIFRSVTRNVPEGVIPPRWALIIRAVLFPLDAFYWHMNKSRGYRWDNDTWSIYGVTYSGKGLKLLAQATGETYRITRTGETLTFERVSG